jgi:squalene-hopene/tetraprenyl-beta-curcumene cyclase
MVIRDVTGVLDAPSVLDAPGVLDAPDAAGVLDAAAVLDAAGGADVAALGRVTLDRATRHLLGLQHADGWWKGELETNVTMDAEDLLLREFLGVRTAEQTAAAARWIRSCQRSDGTWANFLGGDANLSTTVEAYVALRLAGDGADAGHMLAAAAWIRQAGGVPATRVFTRFWLAMFGLWPWDDLPVMPPELIYLPAWFPLNVYDWACWARQTIVPLTIVGSFRPVRTLSFDLPELYPRADSSLVGAGAKADPWAAMFVRLDRALHGYERYVRPRRPAAAVRTAALRRCAEWIITRQERDGCWGGIQPPWVYSLIALNLLGYDLDHPVMRRGLAGLDRFTIWEQAADGPVRRLEACQSPVWDTVLVMIALADAGLPADHPALGSAATWVLAEEIRGPGDWQVRRPKLAPAGWAFEFDNDGYPDVDDTAEVVLALGRVRLPGADMPAGGMPAGGTPAASTAGAGGARDGTARDGTARDSDVRAAIERANAWMIGMQSRDGGWAAFDADNTSKLVARLPFCDFGEVTDPPSADVTAHTVEALVAEGLHGSLPVRRGVTWLLRNQEPDGSWFGRWGANYVYGTGAVVPALIAAGVLPGKPAIRRAVSWLIEHQNPDGGWGEDLRSYEDPSWAGRGESTASQTAWALLALIAAGGEDAMRSAERGVAWLAATQRDDGTWDEPLFTGTGFPGDFYINYHLYRLVFPVSALGRYVRLIAGGGAGLAVGTGGAGLAADAGGGAGLAADAGGGAGLAADAAAVRHE